MSAGPGFRHAVNSPTTVTRRIRRRGEHEISRKTIACGNAGCSGELVVTTLVCYLHFAHEAAGAAGTRHSPRPLFSKGERFLHNSGRPRRESERPCLGCLENVTCSNSASPTPTNRHPPRKRTIQYS